MKIFALVGLVAAFAVVTARGNVQASQCCDIPLSVNASNAPSTMGGSCQLTDCANTTSVSVSLNGVLAGIVLTDQGFSEVDHCYTEAGNCRDFSSPHSFTSGSCQAFGAVVVPSGPTLPPPADAAFTGCCCESD